MWETTGQEVALGTDASALRTGALPASPLLLRAREHLERYPLVSPAAGRGDWLARLVADDPGLLRALGGLRHHEVFGAFDWALDDDALEQLEAGIAERVLATMRWLGLGCVESALSAARGASLDPALAGRIGRAAVRSPGGGRLLVAAGLASEWLPRLAGGSSPPDPAETDAAVRAVYGAHRPQLAELRLRAFSSARWDTVTQPVLREAVLALHGLTAAPADSLVRGVVGGRPWGPARGTTVEGLGRKTRIRILLEVLRRVDGSGLGPASGLALLAGLAGLG